jgi:hypothetical protein
MRLRHMAIVRRQQHVGSHFFLTHVQGALTRVKGAHNLNLRHGHRYLYQPCIGSAHGR